MPKTIANFQCNKCGDIFTAQSDKYYSCKCGLSEVKPDYLLTYYTPEKHNFIRLQDGNDHTYFNENDIYIMSDEILNLFTEIKTLCIEFGFHIYESFKKDEFGKEYLDYIDYTLSDFINKDFIEQNEIEFCARLEKPLNEEKFMCRLQEFKKFLLLLKNNEIKISDRKKLVEIVESWNREQLKMYDYRFNF